MDPKAKKRFVRWLASPVDWHPVIGGKRVWICWEDRLSVDLGRDLNGDMLELLADRMTSGHFYPADAVECFFEGHGPEGTLRAGDRMLQRAPFLPFLPSLAAWSMVELFVVERDFDHCRIGYVTTRNHHGRGIWQAALTRKDTHLALDIQGTSSPKSWLFWLGLPFARYLQLRARRRAVQEFKRLVSSA